MEQEREVVVTDSELVAVLKDTLLDRHVVDERAVETFEIADLE